MGDSKKYQQIIYYLNICFLGESKKIVLKKIRQLKEYDKLIAFKETGSKLKEGILPNGK